MFPLSTEKVDLSNTFHCIGTQFEDFSLHLFAASRPPCSTMS